MVLTRESVSEGIKCDEHSMKEGLQCTLRCTQYEITICVTKEDDAVTVETTV